MRKTRKSGDDAFFKNNKKALKNGRRGKLKKTPCLLGEVNRQKRKRKSLPRTSRRLFFLIILS
jgi:hypothetical protein